MPGKGHGGRPRGYSWPPFESGNQVALKHGCYAMLQLAPRAEQIAAELARLVPIAAEADGPAIATLSLVLAQLERAGIVLAIRQQAELEQIESAAAPSKDERADLRRLTADMRGWANVARRYFEMLGLSPTSRAALSVDVNRGAALRAHLLERYGVNGDGGEE